MSHEEGSEQTPMTQPPISSDAHLPPLVRAALDTIPMLPGGGGDITTGQLPAIMCREPLAFPGQPLTLRLVWDVEKRAAEEALKAGNRLLLIPTGAPDSAHDFTLAAHGAARFGVIAQVVARRSDSDGTEIAKVRVLARALVIRVIDVQPFLLAECRQFEEPTDWTPELSALATDVRNLAEMYLELSGEKAPSSMPSDGAPGVVADWAAACLPWFPINLPLFTLDAKARLEVVLHYLETLLNEIEPRVQKATAPSSRLGPPRPLHLPKWVPWGELPRAARDSVRREYEDSGSEEWRANRDRWARVIADLPWSPAPAPDITMDSAREALNEMYGLEGVKERILGLVASQLWLGREPGPTPRMTPLLLVSPPGCGKTSVASAIAKALQRPFARISMAGAWDTTFVRGVSRAYRGAVPGAIVDALRRCGRLDPVILLDEIGRAQRTSNGDPFGPLLEALDPGQGGFRDDYIGDIELDLSGVLFILTANSIDGVPAALIDRCDVVSIAQYTTRQRREILARHLLPRAMNDLRMGPEQVALVRGATDGLVGDGDGHGLRAVDALLRRVLAAGLREHLESSLPVSITRATVERYSGRLAPPLWWDQLTDISS